MTTKLPRKRAPKVPDAPKKPPKKGYISGCSQCGNLVCTCDMDF